jgi:hypothetical protein
MIARQFEFITLATSTRTAACMVVNDDLLP